MAQNFVNIATLKLYREKRGGQAVMVIESDQEISREMIDQIAAMPGIIKVTYLRGEQI